MAAQTTTFIQLLSILLYDLLYIPAYRDSSILLELSSFLPALAYDFSLMSGIVKGIFELNYTMQKGILALASTTVIYFALFIYFEQVIPHEFGTPKHPLFFIRWIWKKSENKTEH